MSKGIFVTATGTDAGKTYVTALMVKKLHEAGLRSGYYKAALSGADCIKNSDAGYVKKISGIDQEEETLVSYLYQPVLSPHLAARLEKNPPRLSKILADYERVCRKQEYVTVEGSGGIVCPIRWDDGEKLLLEDIIKAMGLSVVLVADAGLGTINSTVLTAEYLKSRGICLKGVIVNRYKGGLMEEDNKKMIEELTGAPVLTAVADGARELDIDAGRLEALYA